MASLSNINGIFDVHSTGAIQFNGNHGTAGQILKSNGNAAPTWVAASTVIGGPYLPLSGGTLTGATATATGISFTVGGALTGTSATFSGNVTSTDLLTVSGDGHLFLGATGETPKIDMMYVDSASGSGWDTRIFTGKTDDLPNGQGFPTSTSAGGYGTQYQANSDGAFFGILPYTAGHYRPVINWGDDVADSPFSFQFNGVDKATVSSAGVITAPTFVGALTGNATTATTLQTARTIAGVSFNGSANISLNNNAITNGAGYTTNTGTVTSVATGNGLTGGTITSTGTLSLDRPNSQLGAVLATYGTTAGSAGRIRCTAPFNTNTGKMFSIEITLYTSYTQHNYVVSAYMYSSTNQWYSPKAIYTTTGTATPDIYVGRDASGKAYISIANASYTGVLVHNMTRGFYTSVADTYDPWTITINSGNENSVSVATSQVWTTANLTPGNYLPLTGGTVTGLTNFTKANGPVVQITKTGSAPGNNTTLIVENTYANHSWGVVQEIRGGGITGTDRPALLFSSPLTSQTWTTGYYQTSDTFAITSNRGYRNGGWGSWRMQVDSSGNTFAAGSSRAPIFYDSNDTGYYLDPNGTSNLNAGTIQGTWTMSTQKALVADNYGRGVYGVYNSYRFQHMWSMGTAYNLADNGTSTGNLYGVSWSHPNAGGAAANLSDHGMLVLINGGYRAAISGSIRCATDMRTPIYYDSNNTGYFGNFASTSVLNALQFNYTQHGSANNIRMGNSTTMNAISSGTNNAAFGVEALGGCSTGSRNFAYGYASLFSLSSGGNNIAMGDATGYNVTSGSNNLLFGQNAGRTGYQSPQSIAGITSGSNQIHMGNESHSTARIQISWTVNSDARDKTDVTPINVGLDFVKDLNPVTFRWDKRSDYEDRVPTGQNKLEELTLGFLAQEVEEVEKSYGYNVANKTNLVVDRDVDQDHFGITYEKMIPILTKAIQEQQVIIDDLKSRIEKLEL